MVGRYDEAMRYVEKAAAQRLVDIAWLDRCPLLEPIRDRPAFDEVRARVRARAQTIWGV